MAWLILLHQFAALVWVGGLFLMYLIVRPALAPLAPAEALPIWQALLGRFFLWIWLAVLALPLTGYAIVFGVWGGMGAAGWHVHTMQLTAIIMILLFGHVYFSPYRRLRQALAANDLAAAGAQLDKLRPFVLANLVLGLITVALGSAGRYL